MSSVYFVDLIGNEYVVRVSGNKIIYKGNKEGYESFIQKHSDSTFIIDDIPKTPEEPTL